MRRPPRAPAAYPGRGPRAGGARPRGDAARTSRLRPGPSRAASSGATWRPGPRLLPCPDSRRRGCPGRAALAPRRLSPGSARPAIPEGAARDPYGNRPPPRAGLGGAAAPQLPARPGRVLAEGRAPGGAVLTAGPGPAGPSARRADLQDSQTPAGRGKCSL